MKRYILIAAFSWLFIITSGLVYMHMINSPTEDKSMTELGTDCSILWKIKSGEFKYGEDWEYIDPNYSGNLSYCAAVRYRK